MIWLVRLLALDLGISPLWKISQIGKRREPVTPGDAIGYVVVAAIYISALAASGALR